MSFMKKQIEHGNWIEVDGPQGTEFIPADLVGQVEAYHGTLIPVPEPLAMYCENRQAWEIKLIEGYGARLSAPGYMDATAWSVFKTEKAAQTYLAEMTEDD